MGTLFFNFHRQSYIEGLKEKRTSLDENYKWYLCVCEQGGLKQKGHAVMKITNNIFKTTKTSLNENYK